MYEMFEQMLAVVKQYGHITTIDLHEAGTYRGAGFYIDGTTEDGNEFHVCFDIKERGPVEG